MKKTLKDLVVLHMKCLFVRLYHNYYSDIVERTLVHLIPTELVPEIQLLRNIFIEGVGHTGIGDISQNKNSDVSTKFIIFIATASL